MSNTIQKHWFHATTKKTLEKIKQSGVLFGNDNCLFLARNLEELVLMIKHGRAGIGWNADIAHKELVLKVKYIPNNINDDYDPKNWEMIVKKPIPLSNIRFLRYI